MTIATKTTTQLDSNQVVRINGEDILYSQMVNELAKPMGEIVLDRLHAAVGISGEAGELLDAIKKNWAYGRWLDRENVIEELGDLEFYMTAMRMLLQVSRQDVLQLNADKLSKRYRTGTYSDKQAQERADKATTEAALVDAQFPVDEPYVVPVGDTTQPVSGPEYCR